MFQYIIATLKECFRIIRVGRYNKREDKNAALPRAISRREADSSVERLN